ncbi:ANTAR domain-containing protein [Actinophytocola sp.]|uniref:ANTAR domain-containing protein n=1 Tax=Actinophytocola sp. TaxID=1872138 RepID=UPI00389A32B8
MSQDDPLGSEVVLADLAARFASLTRALLGVTSVAEALERVVLAARESVPPANLVSVTLRSPDGAFHTPVETDPLATELDQLQYEFGEGACVEAARPDGPAMALSTELAADPRWPRFGTGAAERGFHSLLSTALLPDVQAPRLSGALNVYSRRPEAFTPRDRDVLLLFGTHASLALARTEAVTRSELEAEQLRQAVNSRDVIGQAKGILMAKRRLSAAEAFDVLRRTSQDNNIKLRDLAETLTKNPDSL